MLDILNISIQDMIHKQNANISKLHTSNNAQLKELSEGTAVMRVQGSTVNILKYKKCIFGEL
jgi:hypothetical protein